MLPIHQSPRTGAPGYPRGGGRDYTRSACPLELGHSRAPRWESVQGFSRTVGALPTRTLDERNNVCNYPHQPRECSPPDTGTARASPCTPPERNPAAEGGFLLIEVIVSALLVALIVIATFTGFDVVNRTTADQRHHNQAAVLAAQSQEQLRTNPASTLDALEESPHTYTETVGGTTYTITQSATLINGSTGPPAAPTKNTKRLRAYIEITSSVTWPQLAASTGKRPVVTQSSIITPPDGSGLEVDVTTGVAASPSTLSKT